MLQLEDRCTPAITGLVFEDFNANGDFDSGPTADRGVPGVSVTAYDDANVVVGNTLSDSLGNYILNVTGLTPLRIEFTGLPQGVFFGPQGTASGSAIQFTDNSTASNINLAVVRPEDFRSAATTIVTSMYVIGGDHHR